MRKHRSTMKKPKKSKAVDASTVTSTLALGVLLAGLMLSAYNLSLVVGQSGTLSGLQSSWEDLRNNYASVGTAKDLTPERPLPPVLWSVVKFRDGEREELQLRLVGPFLSYAVASGPEVEALLIERKNPSSRDVSARVFMKDGTETSYLWPSTHADKDGFWIAEEESAE